MTVPEILNKWAEYSEYDPNQTRFNLLSSNYEMHRASEKAKAINAFDNTGKMAVLYLKEMYRQICEQSSVRLISYLKDPTCLKEHLEMWQIFQSDDVTAIENDILGGMNALIEHIVPVKQIGERDKDKEREVLAEAVTSVTEELRECHEVLYTRGKPFGKIQSMSTEIHVFPTITECILFQFLLEGKWQPVGDHRACGREISRTALCHAQSLGRKEEIQALPVSADAGSEQLR